jgi:Immunoglobulin-like domain of bacterial spore germination/Sporulation and spore germination
VEVVAMAGRRRGRTAAALVAVLTVTLLAGCTATTLESGPGAASPSPPSRPSSAPVAGERALPLYYVTDTPAGPRLAREFRRLPVGDDPAAAGSAAVTALLGAPSGMVPGYRNVWPDGSALAAPVAHADGVVTVDLAPQAAAAVPADPLLAVQQLVYTVTGALGTTDPVQLLVAGASVPRLWNDGVDTSRPVARADPLGVRVLVGIDDPAEGATSPSPLRVSGEAAVFEATLHWEVRRGGEVVRSGSATTAEGQRFAPYAFSVALPPGDYEVRVSEDDPSDGAGRPVMTDARRVTVTG